MFVLYEKRIYWSTIKKGLFLALFVVALKYHTVKVIVSPALTSKPQPDQFGFCSVPPGIGTTGVAGHSGGCPLIRMFVLASTVTLSNCQAGFVPGTDALAGIFP
jgi:hypothetical protein